jgi:hypothetical protein
MGTLFRKDKLQRKNKAKKHNHASCIHHHTCGFGRKNSDIENSYGSLFIFFVPLKKYKRAKNI